MNLAPIAVFCYNRPEFLTRTLNALIANPLSSDSAVYFFSDGPKSAKDHVKVEEVRSIIRSTQGFRQKTVIERESNFGLSRNIISGVNQVLATHERIVVLEDDLVTSPYFLRYMNDALVAYSDEKQVVSISGYRYPLSQKCPDTFFLKGADCWGWATWARGWNIFNEDGSKLLQMLAQQNLIKDFDWGGRFPFTHMLVDQILNKNDSWAIRWRAAAYVQGKLTLYPGVSLVHNIGFDGLGTHGHGEPSSLYDVDLAAHPVQVMNNIPLVESEEIVTDIVLTLSRIQPAIAAAPPFSSRLRNLFGRLFRQPRATLKTILKRLSIH